MSYLDEAKKLAKMDYQGDPKVREQIHQLTNYDESLVPSYHLPSPLTKTDGSKVQSAYDWVNFQRPTIFKMFQQEMYGKIPPRPDQVSYEILSLRDDALDNTAIRKEVRLHFSMHSGKTHAIDLLLYTPKSATRIPAPAFLGLCFKGNHATTDEKDVRMTGAALGNPDLLKEESRGCQSARWHFKELVKAGYAGAVVCYHDIFPDRADGWGESVLNLFEDLSGFSGAHEQYSSIGVWAWGLSRALDYLETDPLIDASRVALHGHSRLGKTSLWAGACDRRFRIVISNDSGCGGAALARRMFGETYLFIVNVMPHWFVKPFRKYIANEENMPFDQHFLIALSAPRPVAIASATEDLWADPKGEFLAALHTNEVYKLFGSKGTGTEKMPAAGEYLTSDISYHLRLGKHDQTAFDWEHYIQIANLYLR
ncbi:MAG: acetylxylan esterase [Lentisphaeria bacterium]